MLTIDERLLITGQSTCVHGRIFHTSIDSVKECLYGVTRMRRPTQQSLMVVGCVQAGIQGGVAGMQTEVTRAAIVEFEKTTGKSYWIGVKVR